jgi:hypothetical protein
MIEMTVKALIYVRSKEGTVGSIHYDFDPDQFEQLIKDYESYVKQGYPVNGKYVCRSTDSHMATLRRLFLQFERIQKIEKVEPLLKETEEDK